MNYGSKAPNGSKSLGCTAIPSAPYRSGPKQRKLGREESDKMQEAGVAEPAVKE